MVQVVTSVTAVIVSLLIFLRVCGLVEHKLTLALGNNPEQ